jgi:hypothetical protein
MGREGCRYRVSPHPTAARDFSSQASEPLCLSTDAVIPSGGPAPYLRLPQKAGAHPGGAPAPFPPPLASQTAARPLLLTLVSEAMRMGRTDPVMAGGHLQDRLGPDALPPRRAQAGTAQDCRAGPGRIACSPQLPSALAHRVVAGDVLLVQNGREDASRRAMATAPEALALHPIRGRPLHHPACNQAAQQRLTLRVTALRARPQLGEALTPGQPLRAALWRHRRLTRRMGAARCRRLRLPPRAASVLPRALEFGRREAGGRGAGLVAAPGQGGGAAGVTSRLLRGGCQPLALPLTLRQYLVSGVKRGGR